MSYRPHAANAIRAHWPLLLVLLFGVFAWADLRGQLAEIRDGSGRTPASVQGGSSARDEREDDRWDCDAAIPPESVRSALGRHGADVFACYQSRRERVPELAGTLNLELRVADTGSITGARVEGDLARDAELVECVRRAVSSWRFSAPPRGSCGVVSAPFMLSPTP